MTCMSASTKGSKFGLQVSFRSLWSSLLHIYIYIYIERERERERERDPGAAKGLRYRFLSLGIGNSTILCQMRVFCAKEISLKPQIAKSSFYAVFQKFSPPTSVGTTPFPSAHMHSARADMIFCPHSLFCFRADLNC